MVMQVLQPDLFILYLHPQENGGSTSKLNHMMKKVILSGVIFVTFAISGLGQSKKTMILLQEGIKTNDTVKCNLAISKGATFKKEDLTSAIHENNFTLAKFMVGHGVSSTSGLLIASKENNLEMVNLMLTLNPSLSSSEKDVDGSVYMVSGKTSKQVPVAIKTDSAGKSQFIADSLVVDFLLKNAGKGYGFYFRYKTKYFRTGSLAMYDAIANKNSSMVKSLLSHGYDVYNPIFHEAFDDFTISGIGFMSGALLSQILSNGGTINLNNGTIWAKPDTAGYIVTCMIPTPAKKINVLEFAKKINDAEITSMISTEWEKRLAQMKEASKLDSLRYDGVEAKVDSLIRSGYKLIVPGIGFDSVEVGKTSFENIVSKFGKTYEKINHNKYSTEIFYKDLGLSFYFYYKKKLGKVFCIHLSAPFKGVTSKGIVVNESEMRDVIKFYGPPHYFSTDTNSWNEYDGVKFFKRKEVSSNPMLEKIIEIGIVGKSQQ
jgi:hypothetical protein